MTEPSVGIPFVDFFLALLADYGYPITAAFAFTENVFVLGSFVPGETIVMAASFVSVSGRLDWLAVWAVAFVASFAGGNLSYFVGRHGGRPAIERLMRRFHISESRLLAAEAYFAEHGSETVFLARWVAGVKNLVPALAGVSRMSLGWFELYSVLGTFVYTTILVALGYFFGEYLETIVGVVQGGGWGLLAFFAILGGYTWYRLRMRRKRRRLRSEAGGEPPAVGGSTRARGVESSGGVASPERGGVDDEP